VANGLITRCVFALCFALQWTARSLGGAGLRVVGRGIGEGANIDWRALDATNVKTQDLTLNTRLWKALTKRKKNGAETQDCPLFLKAERHQDFSLSGLRSPVCPSPSRSARRKPSISRLSGSQ